MLKFIKIFIGSFFSIVLYRGRTFRKKSKGRKWFPRYPGKYFSKQTRTFPFRFYNTWQNRFLSNGSLEEYNPSQMM